MSKVKGQMPKVKCQRSNAKGQMSNAKGQISKVKCHRSNATGQMPQVKGQMSNVKGQTSAFCMGDIRQQTTLLQ